MSEPSVNSKFVSQLATVERDLKAKLFQDESVRVFKITKNDSIKNKVEAILKFIGDNEIVLLGGVSNGVAKLIAITEIVKQKEQQLFQYNTLLKIESTTNPNHKNKPDVDSKTQDEVSLEKKVLEEINGPKVFTLPSMYILLTKKDILEGIDMMSWTKQKTS